MLPILFLTQRGQWIIWKPEEAQGKCPLTYSMWTCYLERHGALVQACCRVTCAQRAHSLGAHVLTSDRRNGGMQRGNGSLEVKFHGIRSQRRPTALPDELRTILENVIIAYCSKRSN